MDTNVKGELSRTGALALSAAVATIFLVVIAPFPGLSAATSSGGGYNMVQVSIQPTGNFSATSYTLTAYNSSGAAVASYQGNYPQVAFALPSGTYLLVAVASSGYGNGPCYSSPAQASGGATGAPAVQSGQGVASSAIAYPCYMQATEYGYSLSKIDSSTTINITAQAPSETPTTSITVSVSYKNGSAVSGAQVSASPVGGWYWGSGAKLQTSVQTGSDGTAHLVIPSVPVIVSAWKSVPIDIPKSQSTVQVNIGGQLVNVTIYYGPSDIYLQGTGLLVPPQSKLSIVVLARQTYPVVPYLSGGATSAPGTLSQGQGAADANGNSTLPAQQTSIPPFDANGEVLATQPLSHAETSSDSLLAAGAVGLVAVVATVGIAFSRMRR